MEEKLTEIHNRVARRQRELNEREDTLAKRVEEVKNSTYEERRLAKSLITAIPYTALALAGIVLSGSGVIPASIVPIIAMFGGKITGDIAECIIYNKMNKNEFQEVSNNSKEKRRVYLEIEKENAKCDAYINEYEYNHILHVDNSRNNGNKINRDRLTKSKDKYQSRLKDINTKLVLSRNYRIYESKTAALLKHLGKTALWTLELVLSYTLIKGIACGTILGFDLLLPLTVGGLLYGSYNMTVMKARLEIFKKYNALPQTSVSLDDIESIKNYQREYIDKIGNIKVVEEYKKCIDEFEEKKLNTDPIERDYSRVCAKTVEPAPVDKHVYKEEEVYPDNLEVIYTESGNKLIRRKK